MRTEDILTNERDLRDLIEGARHRKRSRRGFIRSMIALGLTAPMAMWMLAKEASSQLPSSTPALSRLIFFDWDKDSLTDRARQIIEEAVNDWSRVQFTRIEVNGYDDTSQDPAHSLELSIRRANAVKAELIRDGIPADAITVMGYGATHLLIPTEPGVREPQNRRVEVIVR